MTEKEGGFAAVDIGASSGRVIHGRIGPGRIELTEIRRFRNGPVLLPDGLYWDALGLYTDVLAGLQGAVQADPELLGLAIDTWAVDYGLIDESGMLVGNPRHYRDSRPAMAAPQVHEVISPVELYQVNGLQYLPFNTLYQFAADAHTHDPQVQALLMPDLFGYWLTGRAVAEQTNASTTGLLDARTGTWSRSLLDRLGWPERLLPELVPPGTVIGEVTDSVREHLGTDRPLPVTSIGSHDTASAVVGVPATSPRFGYISCGTWGLVGVELDAPVLTEESRAANFTNERGVDGTIRYLANVMGLWLLSESVRSWQLRHPGLTLSDLLHDAAQLPTRGPLIDPDDPVFLAPGDMPARITAALAAGGRSGITDPTRITRIILDSLATTFAARIEQAEHLSDRSIDVIHMVGGGAQNELLCQLTADAAGRPVVAGPVEATAIGNLLVQARTHGVLAGDRWDLRTQLRAAVTTRAYTSSRTPGRYRTRT